MPNFDPYHKWLGIRPEEQPANHYRLLALTLFEDDPDTISSAADQRMAHIRSFQTGTHAALSQSILNELAAARVCLLNPQKKAEYDRQLQAKLTPKSPPAAPTSESPVDVVPDLDYHPTYKRHKKPTPRWMPWVFPIIGVVVAVVLLVLVARQGGDEQEIAKAPVASKPLPPVSPKVEPKKSEPTPKPEVKPQSEPKAQPEPIAPRGEESKPGGVKEYLADLKANSSDVCLNHPPEFIVRGTRVPHGVWGHPPGDSRPSRISFDLNGGFRWLAGGAGIVDGARPASPLTFRVDGDGKVLWRSRPLQKGGQNEAFQVRMEGVKKLELIVECPGHYGDGWALWMAPVLTDTPLSESEPEPAEPKLTLLEDPKPSPAIEPPKVDPKPDTPPQARRPVPDDDAQEKATKLIKEVYGNAWVAAKANAEKQPSSRRINTLVLWNEHNGNHIDRGTDVCNVALLQGKKELWRKNGLRIPWAANKDMFLVVPVPRTSVSADAVRVEIVRWHTNGGGLSEVQVLSGKENIAQGCRVTASANYSGEFSESKLTDGITTSAEDMKGYWLLPDRTQGWAEIHLRDSEQPGSPSTLANELLQKAKETNKDDAAHFVLLRLCRDIATQTLDDELAFEAIDLMASEYDISGSQMKAVVIEKAARKVKTPEQRKALADAAVQVIDEAMREDNFDIAKQVGTQTSQLARLAKNEDLLQEVAAKNKEVEVAAKTYTDAQEGMATLKEKPDDPEANLIVGKYQCFNKGDWDKGLPMLANGSDEKMKALAEKDIAGVDSANEQVKLGDAWWEVSKERAAYWYEQTLPGLAGLEKDRVEKRVQLAHAATGDVVVKAGSQRRKWLVLFRSSDPSIWNTDTKRGPKDFARSLSSLPQNITHLRLTDLTSRQSITIPMDGQRLDINNFTDGDNLDVARTQGRLVWYGDRKVAKGAHHIGIIDTTASTDKVGTPCINLWVTAYRCWGFGHPHLAPAAQAYGWAGKAIPSTTFEIAVLFKDNEAAPKRQVSVSSSQATGTAKAKDLLKLVDPIRNSVRGTWRKVGSQLAGTPSSMIAIPAKAGSSYQLELQFTRISGEDIGFVFPVGPDVVCQLFIDMFGVASGLSTIENGDPRLNKTKVNATGVVNGRPCTLDITVSVIDEANAEIQISLDGKPCLSWKGTPAGLTVSPLWKWPADVKFALGSGNTSVVFHRITLRTSQPYKQALPGLEMNRVEKRADQSDGRPAASKWMVLFRSANPRLWNREVNNGRNDFSISVSKAPDDTKFLRLSSGRNMYVVIPMTKSRLAQMSDNEDRKYGWNGTANYTFSAYELGIYNNDWNEYDDRTSVTIREWDFKRGWGFGRIGHKGEQVQAYAWEGKRLPGPVVFEIAVTNSELSNDEAKRLLKQ